LDPVAGAGKRGEEDAKATFEKGKKNEKLKTGFLAGPKHWQKLDASYRSHRYMKEEGKGKEESKKQDTK